MGLNSQGYRTDPGHQIVKVSALRTGGRLPQKEIRDFISSGAPIPRFTVRWDEEQHCYFLEKPTTQEKAAFGALSYLGYTYAEVEVVGDDPPLDDIIVENVA